MNKLVLIVFVALMISSAFALDSLGTFKQYDSVRITQVCQDASWINISSIALPNSTIVYPNTRMISAGSGEFYFIFNKTADLGKYDVRGISDGCEKTFAVYFTITPTVGAEDNTTMFIIIGLIAILLLILGALTRNYIFSTISGFTILIAGIYSMIYGFGSITNVYTQMISVIIAGIGAIITIISSLGLLEDFDFGGSKEDDDD